MGSTAENGIAENGPLHLPENVYNFKVVKCVNEGASVNFGKKTGLTKRMADGNVASKNPLR